MHRLPQHVHVLLAACNRAGAQQLPQVLLLICLTSILIGRVVVGGLVLNMWGFFVQCFVRLLCG
jgi:hypothetical protein